MPCTFIYRARDPAGVLAATSDADIVMSNHRAHGHYLAKGCDIYKMTAEIYGKKWLCRRQRWINAFNRFI